MKIKNTEDLIDRLRHLTRSINRDYRINATLNSGGCAFFAVKVAKAVKLNVLGLSVFSHKPQFGPDGFEKLITISKKDKKNQNVDFWYNNGVLFNHVVVKFLIDGKVKYYDGEHGLMSERTAKKKFKWNGCEIGVIPVDLMAPLVKTQHGWNPMFQSRKEVHALIKGHLQDKWNA